MVLEAFGQALHNFGIFDVWLFMVAGVMVGLIFGIIPGVGGILAMALFLPFVFSMSVLQALPFLVAIASVVYTGGSITAILLNVPGTDTNAATLIDGYPMSQKGEAGRALGAALGSSGAGGAVTVFMALVTVPMVLPIVFAIRSADMVFIILLGLSFVGVLGAGSMVKGLISGGLGLLVSFIGYHIGTGAARFTFGSIYLYDGVPLVPLALGLFAVPEMVILSIKGGSIAGTGVVVKGMGEVLEGVKDVFRHWSLWLRSSVIGYIVGLIPGIGGMTAIFIAYGQAKQTSKHPEKFGTGVVEGVIAPESANNAVTGGALLTTLALGVPGNATCALLLGAFLIIGLIPGPEMMRTHLDLSLTLLLVVVITNVLAVVICLPAARYLAKTAFIPGRILVPLVMVISLVGTFAYQERFNDIIVALIFSAVGLSMSRFGYNRPALFLGYILGIWFEHYFFIAIKAAGPLFFMRPISLTLIFITIALFAFGPMKRLFKSIRDNVRIRD